MKTKRATVKSILEYVDTPLKVRKLLSLVPKKNRAFVSDIIRASTDSQTNWPGLRAQYYRRLSHAVVELEAQETKKSKKTGRKIDPESIFEIGTQGALTEKDTVLGDCHMRYFNYSLITSGPFRGQLQLERRKGGVTFTFLNGLPEGAELYFFLDWTWGYRRAFLSPLSAAVPRNTLYASGHPDSADFKWTIVVPNKQVIVSIKDNNPLATRQPEFYTVVFSTRCLVRYY
jgi:hypothetical protein